MTKKQMLKLLEQTMYHKLCDKPKVVLEKIKPYWRVRVDGIKHLPAFKTLPEAFKAASTYYD